MARLRGPLCRGGIQWLDQVSEKDYTAAPQRR